MALGSPETSRQNCLPACMPGVRVSRPRSQPTQHLLVNLDYPTLIPLIMSTPVFLTFLLSLPPAPTTVLLP
jgi:hypothetical protein